MERVELALPLVRRGEGPTAPEDAAGCVSRVTFSWVGKLISEGYERERRRARGELQGGASALTAGDLLELRRDDAPRLLAAKASEAWQRQRPSLVRALRQAFGGPYIFAALFKVTYDSLQMVGPYILKHLLNYLTACATAAEAEAENCGLETGMMYVMLILCSAFLQTSVLHQYFHSASALK